MYIEAIVLGFIIGIIRNGRLNNFLEMRFRGWGLIVIAFISFIVPYVLKIVDVQIQNPQIFVFAASVLTLLIALLNLDKRGMKLFLVGGILNLVIMGLNHFMMPVNLTAMETAGMTSLVESIKDGSVINYIDLANAHFLSLYLGKILILPDWYPLSRLLSIGDILMSIGIMLLVQGEMLMFSSKKHGTMLSFTYTPKR